VQLAAADKHVTELKQQLQDALEKLKLQSASGFPHSHRLYRITSGDERRMLLQLICCCAAPCSTCSLVALNLITNASLCASCRLYHCRLDADEFLQFAARCRIGQLHKVS